MTQRPTLPEGTGVLKKYVEATMAPAARIRHAPLASDASALNHWVSHFGGQPYAPSSNLTWPLTPAGQRMHFIGQVNLAEVVEQAPGLGQHLPRRGLLQFFYDMRARVWGYGPADDCHWRFLWYPDVVPAAASIQSGPSCPRRARQMVFDEVYSIPDPMSMKMLARDCGEKVSGAEFATYDRWAAPFENSHQLGGSPWLVQGHAFSVAQLASHGFDLYSGNGFLHTDAFAAELLKWRDEWTLLWQISSDEDLGYCWGAAGVLYIMIRRSDLSRGDLSQPWVVVEFY